MRKLMLLLATLVVIIPAAIANTGSVKGIVRDNSGPVPGVNIYIDGTLLGTITDAEGRFILNNVPAGDHKLVVSCVGFARLTKDVKVETGATFQLGVVVLNESATELNDVIVVGSMASSEARAINIKKNSLAIKDVIAADGIGKLPDRNAAEAVQRIAGVSIERDQAEGRFVAVRGLPSEWSSATLNGDRIPAAEEETGSRAAAFDFFPSELIEIVEVSKAITPDMEGDALGGSVNFITRTAPISRTFNATLGGGYNAKAQGGIYSANVLYGDRSKDGKFGFTLN